MCVVSAVYDYGRGIPPQHWTPPAWYDFQELIKQAEQFDETAGEPDCEDPGKSEWAKDIEERIQRLERIAELENQLEEERAKLNE